MTVAVVDMFSAEAEMAFVETLRRTGFAVLRNPPLDARRMLKMADDWRDFFYGEEKWEYLAEETPSGNTSGYIPPDVSETAVGHDRKDLKEFFHIVPDTILPAALADDAEAHLGEVQVLGRLLLGWLDIHMGSALGPGLRGQLAESLSPADSLLRILHYPPLTGDEPPGAVRAAAHEDINLITLLPVSSEPGLQVLGRDGQWTDVPGIPGDIIVNSGDMLQEASRRQLPSTSHRVINPPDADSNLSRISMPYFLAPDLDIQLSPQHTAGSYLRERLDLLAR
ncbi:2OG-Fe(II) oxygenase family protein [Congregibacter litoralis]|uniref:2-oxoglutarate-dependent ethylene/succinate-forming enzyme n=1 Tax=Congregibacter litoralis KT71 TaxID=314285 RepID=A4A7I1_9GAMM|nr:2OG-Fe(II) oxygenase family protein [Congregibacter litoralis]EAQ98250.1 Isopenicillin N synthase [Congregibacter litoralis KT71]